MKDLSIVIVNWNTKELVLDCINSIIESKTKVKYEIIVVDNGSTEGSVEALRKIKEIKLIENKENLGFAKANNQGIKIAEGKYILLLNSDTKVKRGSIDKLYKFAKEKAGAGVVGSRLLNPDGSIQASCFRFPTIISAINEYWLGQRGLTAKYIPDNSTPTQVDVVVGASFLITPQAIKKVGLLDERFFFFFEDLDYCRRVYKEGLKVYYLPESEVVHYHGSSNRKVVTKDGSWRSHIPGSKIYHGIIKHYIINFIIWSGQKWQKLFR